MDPGTGAHLAETGAERTRIFGADDAHCGLAMLLLKTAFAEPYGTIDGDVAHSCEALQDLTAA